VQIGVFVVGFLLVALWESRNPRRQLSCSTGWRWGLHGLLFGTAMVAVPVLLRATPLAAAVALESSGGKGLLITLREFTLPAALVATFLINDLTSYLLHRLIHAVPALWRVHEIHHSDPDFDVATGLRFHPIEVLAGTASQVGVVLLFGPPVWAVLAAQLIEISMNFLTHANSALPRPLEHAVRYLLITPDIHRIHHSADARDYSRNFGQSLSIWDRAFGTLLNDPAVSMERMTTGVAECRPEDCLKFKWLLMRPFMPRRNAVRGVGDVRP
jgi:sterol desaturase/sphingolipid hydroxylase (fatty acid hydroxylase superfamily)